MPITSVPQRVQTLQIRVKKNVGTLGDNIGRQIGGRSTNSLPGEQARPVEEERGSVMGQWWAGEHLGGQAMADIEEHYMEVLRRIYVRAQDLS